MRWFKGEEMKQYYAIFKRSRNAIEVEFPDLEGCVTFGKDWDEAYENAIDALAAWLAHAQASFVRPPSTHKALEDLNVELVPVPVDEKIIASYEDLKRINIIIPLTTLEKIDDYRKKIGLKRSTFLVYAAEEYLERHSPKNDELQYY
jgi:predicted RNase H-like HicB family nuclease